MLIRDLHNKKVLIWGLGQEGRAFIEVITPNVTAEFYVHNDSDFTASDLAFLESFPDVKAIERGDLDAVLDTIEVIIKSPGVSLYRDEIQHALAHNVIVTSGTNLWFAENPAAKTIVVSASKGKSTTSALLAHILEQLGCSVRLAGNIGVPLISCLGCAAVDYWVVELSSYQLADFTGTASHGLLLNIFSDHLDWHGSQEQYELDKLRLLQRVAADGHALLGSSLRERSDSKVLANVLFYDSVDNSLQVSEEGISFKGENHPLSSELFPGVHTRKNVVAAITLLSCLGFSVPDCIKALNGFTPLPHRLTPVANIDNILFVDDSISTIPQSCAAAVASLSPRSCILIVGGYDRGVSWSESVPDLLSSHVKAVICTGQNGARIKVLLPENKKYYLITSFDDAVRHACNIACSGDVVLLSPGAPSFDEFSDYKERGLRFLEIVREGETQGA